MHIVECEDWKDFHEKLSMNESSEKYGRRYELGSIFGPIFRGHASALWKLETTLERYLAERRISLEEYDPKQYHHLLQNVLPYINSLTEKRFEVPPYNEEKTTILAPDAYEFMIYLRHHGFPSPLLDWTQSPYIAAFFAFEKALSNENYTADQNRAAIFCYREQTGKGKLSCLNDPHIRSFGPTVITHKRHFQQQCQYTSCYRVTHDTIGENLKFACHQDVTFNTDKYDLMTKYIIPTIERKNILNDLDLMGINKFSLFGNEEGLMETLAFREIELETMRKDDTVFVDDD